MIVIVVVTAYEDAAFWFCGARNVVATLAAAFSAHEYCRLQHLCIDFFLMFVCLFFLFDARLLFLDVRSLVTGKLLVIVAPVIVLVTKNTIKIGIVRVFSKSHSNSSSSNSNSFIATVLAFCPKHIKAKAKSRKQKAESKKQKAKRKHRKQKA